MELMDRDELDRRLDGLEQKLGGLAHAVATDEPQQYFTKREAAEYLRVSKATVDRLRGAGKLQASRISDGPKPMLIFRRCDLDGYVEHQLELDNDGVRDKARGIKL